MLWFSPTAPFIINFENLTKEFLTRQKRASLQSISDEARNVSERLRMPKDSKATATSLAAPEFLAALERSGILPDAKWREVQARFVDTTVDDDSSCLARQLIEEGTLTEFQARRLLKGKKSLALGRYTLLEHLGQGARGRVFKARHRLMDRVVALKVLVPDSRLDKTSVSRFFREMKIVALLDHPNVVRAIDADVHEGCPYLVMEYLDGDDLAHVFARRGPLPPDEVIEYMAQASRGLAHAHERGVIHRDVKPTNMFLVNSGIVKVLDLGFGELVGMAGQAGNVFDTDEGVVVGTTDFMSPEQVKDKPIDARTDLFSLGCTMYRLLTGAYAFPGTTREERLVKRIRGRHVPITDVVPGLSYRLVEIVDRLLAIRPDDRFSSAAEVADALDALLPAARRSERMLSPKSATTGPGAGAGSVPAAPEAPVDWSLVESALRPTGYGARRDTRLVDQSERQPSSAKRLSSHRKVLEGEGIESGREVHEKYRSELIQMNRAMAELRSTDSNEEAPAAGATLFERIGEKVGDYLAEPGAVLILVAALVVLVILVLAIGVALG
jgi:eukaryotic-like serine/threonine-protein kinase